MLLIKHHHQNRCADYQTGLMVHVEENFFCVHTCVEHLLDDHSHLPLQHGVEQLDNEDEAGAEDKQRQSQENEAHCQVWQINIDEEVFACNGTVKEMIGIKVSTFNACIM